MLEEQNILNIVKKHLKIKVYFDSVSEWLSVTLLMDDEVIDTASDYIPKGAVSDW